MSSSFEETSSSSSKNIPHNSPMYHCYLSRPPPLRTCSTYDDDEAFNNVALNLLSRHNTLGLSATEAILATLIDTNQRSSFYEALCIRLDRLAHLSPNTASFVHCLNENIGKELREMVLAENKGEPCYAKKPVTPRGIGYCRNMKQKVNRRFFPDGEKGMVSSPIPSTATGGGIFGSKRRVQNIDWKLAEAIQQVNHLRLDGSQTSPPQKMNGYEAPTRGF
jgi:hypothetical protein